VSHPLWHLFLHKCEVQMAYICMCELQRNKNSSNDTRYKIGLVEMHNSFFAGTKGSSGKRLSLQPFRLILSKIGITLS